jgi:hypothetical protein
MPAVAYSDLIRKSGEVVAGIGSAQSNHINITECVKNYYLRVTLQYWRAYYQFTHSEIERPSAVGREVSVTLHQSNVLWDKVFIEFL